MHISPWAAIIALDIMNYEFETWWREEGQFIPLLDVADEETRSSYKPFSFTLWKLMQDEKAEVEVELEKEHAYCLNLIIERDEVRNELVILKNKIQDLLNV